MPFEFLDDTAVRARLVLDDVLPALERAFVGLSTGHSVQPPQTLVLLPADAGDTIFYPGVLAADGLVGMKISPYLTGLAARDEPPVTAYTLVLSTDTGRPLLLCDSAFLTTVRTAGTTILAVRELTRADASTLAVVGSGAVAEWHLRLALTIRAWERIVVVSPTLAQADRADRRERLQALHPAVTVSADPTSADGHDVVMLCTSSATPVIDVTGVGRRSLVTSISTNAPGAHEIAPSYLLEADVFCDLRSTAPLAAGEMLLAAGNLGWDADDIRGDLPELLTGAVRPDPTWARPRFFRSIGLGIEDLAVANLLLDRVDPTA